MVLYSVITTYHLLEAIVHKNRCNESEKGVLFISDWLIKKYPWYLDLCVFFEKVIVFRAGYQYDKNVRENLNTYFNGLFQKEGIDVAEIEELHVFGAEHAFGAYVFENEYKTCYWEEGAGALSKKDSMLEIFQKVHGPEKAKYQYEMHLGDGEQPFVEKRFYNKYFQLSEVEGDNLVHFDLAEELEQLNEKSRSKIIELFYGDDKIKVDMNSALLLTEHFANLAAMTWQEQAYLYRYLVDYFLQDYSILVKPHPDDVMPYEYMFENCKVIRKTFPAELLPFIFERKPVVVATSSSTSIYGMRSRFDKVLEFNFKFSHEKQFYNLNRYFVALSCADEYVKKGWRLNLIGVNPVMVDNFTRFCGLCTEKYTDFGANIENVKGGAKGKNIWLVDEIDNPHGNAEKVSQWLNRLSGNDIVFFLNSDESFCFYDYNMKRIWKSISPIEIKTKGLPEMDNSVSLGGPQINEDKSEMIYVYQKGGKFMLFGLKKELPNVGVSVEAQGFDCDKYQVKILEGMLEATEKRLLYYIEREKELLDELKEKK